MPPRSGAGVWAQPAIAAFAAAAARSTSSLPERGHRPIRSLCRAGLRFSKYAPVDGSTHSPPMKFLNVSAIAPCVFRGLQDWVWKGGESTRAGKGAPTASHAETQRHGGE